MYNSESISTCTLQQDLTELGVNLFPMAVGLLNEHLALSGPAPTNSYITHITIKVTVNSTAAYTIDTLFTLPL